jgi:hypothetical protein
MSIRVELLPTGCDAPSYDAVSACETLGFDSPLDVRWCHVSQDPIEQPSLSRSLVSRLLTFVRKTRSLGIKGGCTCGEPIPELKVYTLASGQQNEARYSLGQCPHCRTMFWGDGRAPSSGFDEGIIE